MAEDRLEIVTGAGVLIAAIGFLAYAMGGNRLALGGDSYPLTASFRSVEGIGVGTDVRLAGVKIGTITELKLNPETFFADATIDVQKGILLPEDSAILISSEGLLGGNYVELVPGGSSDMIAEGGEIEDTQGAVSLITLLMKWIGGNADKKDSG